MHPFEAETLVEQLTDTRYAAHVSPAWSIGDNPNGGYLVSIVLRALAEQVPHPDPLSLTTHFLRPGLPDTACEVEVTLVRTGRTLSTVRASLQQDGKSRLEVLGAFGDLAQSAGVDADISVTPPPMPAPDACVPRSGDAQGVTLPIMSRLDVRLHPQHAAPGATGKPEMTGWIRFTEERPPDTRCLCLFADAFPPSPFGMLGGVGWVPTLELTVHVRRKPASGWIQGQFIADDLNHGRLVESGALWDSTGQLVAQSRQLGLVLDRS